MSVSNLAVGCLFESASRRTEDAQNPVDAAGEKLRALVADKLEDDAEFRTLINEAKAGLEAPSPSTAQRMALELATAAQQDPMFARALETLVEKYQAAQVAIAPVRAENGGAGIGETAFLANYVRFLSPDTPADLCARADLAAFLNNPENQPAGTTLLESVVSDCAQVLGHEHRFTHIARNHLAGFLGSTGNPAAATAAFEALLSSCVPLLGPDHPIVTNSDLALFLRGRVNPAAAEEAFEALLADCLLVFGPEHPVILSARDNLAGLRRGAVSPAPAAQALEDSLIDLLRILLPEHPVILKARNHVAGLLGQSSGPTAGAGALKALLADCLRVLGPNDSITQSVDHSFGYWFSRTRSA